MIVSNNSQGDPLSPLSRLYVELHEAIQILFLREQKNIQLPEIIISPSHIQSDFSFPTFSLGNDLQMRPEEIAHKISAYLSNKKIDLVKNIFSIGPYVNISVDKPNFARKVFKNICSQKKVFINEGEKREQSVVVLYYLKDFFEPFSLDGLRQLFIGQVVANYYKHSKGNISQHYYFADWNEHVLSFLYTLKNFSRKIGRSTNFLKILQTAQNFLATQVSKPEKVKADSKLLFENLDSGKKNMQIFFKTWHRKILKEIAIFHKSVDARSLTYYSESDFLMTGNRVVEDAISRGIANRMTSSLTVLTVPTKETGAIVLRKHNGRVTSLVRHTAFLRSLILKRKPQKVIFLSQSKNVDEANQLIELAKQMDYCRNVEIDLINLNSVEIVKRNLKLSKKIRFALLRISPNKKISPNFDEKISFSGFIPKNTNKINVEDLTDQSYFELSKMLMEFSATILRMKQTNDPSYLCNYVIELSDRYKKIWCRRDDASKAARKIILNCSKLLSF